MAAKKKNTTSAGTVVFRMNEHGNIEFLLVRHEKNNKWGFPKGHLEEGESIEECAVRETWEETGVVARLLFELPPVVTSNKNENKSVCAFMAKQLNPQHGITPKDDSIAETAWFEIDKLPKVHAYQERLIYFAKKIIESYMK